MVGQGSFGAVHKAVWRGCLVAAKIIQTQEKKKIKDEVEKYRQAENLVSYMHVASLSKLKNCMRMYQHSSLTKLHSTLQEVCVSVVF